MCQSARLVGHAHGKHLRDARAEARFVEHLRGGLGRVAEDAHDAEVARVGDEKVVHVDIRIGKGAAQAGQAALFVLNENGELFNHRYAPLR